MPELVGVGITVVTDGATAVTDELGVTGVDDDADDGEESDADSDGDPAGRSWAG